MTTVMLSVEIGGKYTEILCFTIRDEIHDGWLISVDSDMLEKLDLSKTIRSIQQAQADKLWAFPWRYCRYHIGSDQLQALLELCDLHGINYYQRVITGYDR